MTPGFSRWILVFVSFGLLAACGRKSPAGGDSHGHAHQAPHGGQLVEIGDHAYNLELVRDAAAGKLTVYVLDGHAGNFIRIEAPSLAVIAEVGGERQALTLRAVANPATGETVGNSAQFEGAADWLKTATGFEATIKTLPIRGQVFSDVKAKVPAGR